MLTIYIRLTGPVTNLFNTSLNNNTICFIMTKHEMFAFYAQDSIFLWPYSCFKCRGLQMNGNQKNHYSKQRI